jgi:hypothetical protein
VIASYFVSYRTSYNTRTAALFISDEIGVTECSYEYQGARVAGSDHGIVTAELQLC